MRNVIVSPSPTIKPRTYSGTARVMKAKTIKAHGIFPGLHMRTPWPSPDNGCDCGRGDAKPVLHARWCEVRIDWSWGDE